MITHSNKTLGLQRLCGSAFALAVVAAVVSTIPQDSSGDEADKGELIQGRDGVRAILEEPVKGKIELSSNTRTNLQRTIDVSMEDYSGPVDMKDRLGI